MEHVFNLNAIKKKLLSMLSFFASLEETLTLLGPFSSTR